jgi:hypothetical protein
VLLLALTIISTVAAVSGALSALGLLPQRRAEPETVVIVITRIETLETLETLAVEPQAYRLGENAPELGSVALSQISTIRGYPFNRSNHKILVRSTATTTTSRGVCSSAPLKWRPLSTIILNVAGRPTSVTGPAVTSHYLQPLS